MLMGPFGFAIGSALNWLLGATGYLFILALLVVAVRIFADGLGEGESEDGFWALWRERIGFLLMLGFMVLEFILDYGLKTNFRRSRWGVIAYVTFFFAATGGMLGVAMMGGPVWMTVSLVLFFVMATLAFIQRRVTGM